MNTRIFILGNLNVDYMVSARDFLQGHLLKSDPQIGGTAYNAAKAFKEFAFEPVLIGSVGRDYEGQLIREALKRDHIRSIIRENESKPTGCCYMAFSGDTVNSNRLFKTNPDNANQYNMEFLEKAFHETHINRNDLLFVAAHFLTSNNLDCSRDLFKLVSQQEAKIILDLVPHDIYKRIKLKQFRRIIENSVRVLIAEFFTLMKLIDHNFSASIPTEEDWDKLLTHYQAKIIVIRYGPGNISNQASRLRTGPRKGAVLSEESETGYLSLPLEKRRGFGDLLTADLMARFLELILAD